jgi:chaperonin GroES
MNEDKRKPRITAVLNRLQGFIDAKNVADELDDEKLSEIGLVVCDEYEIDRSSREEWERNAKRSMDIALQVREAKNWPFQNASNVKWPLITVAALQFNARAYPAIVDTDKIVKAKVIGNDDGVPMAGPDGQPVVHPETGEVQWAEGQHPGAKRERADRISEHMSYQLAEEMTEWDEDTDTLLMQLPIVGCGFRKVYYDTVRKRNRSEMIAAVDLVVNQSARSLEEAPRISHCMQVYPSTIMERQRAGLWLDVELGDATNGQGDKDAPHDIIEQHRLLDLDEDGYGEPYIVTVHQETQNVLRVVANYGSDDVHYEGSEIKSITRRDYFVKYPFIPDPKGGFYDIGFGSLLESLGAAIDTTMNQMLDAGTLQNAGGGFIGSGVRLKKSQVRMEPGVYKTIDASGSKLREAIYNMEHPGPSSVLFNLLGLMIDAAKDITAVQDIMTGDSGGKNQTATTTLALIEQGMKVFTAIYKRIYRALKREFKILYRLNAENLDEAAYFNVLDEQRAVGRRDYETETYDVCPVADPRIVTDQQRMARINVLLQIGMNNPLVNQEEILRRSFMASGQEDIDALFDVPQQEPDPMMMAGAEAEIAEKQAKAQKTGAEAKKVEIDTMVAAASVDNDRAKIEQGNAELELKAQSLLDTVIGPEAKEEAA